MHGARSPIDTIGECRFDGSRTVKYSARVAPLAGTSRRLRAQALKQLHRAHHEQAGHQPR